ncbi:MAG: helicase-associated domain-containing protein, partial [Gemmataceae bacterium]|nr:helicase-associated domain-containing protein [Gemmataceae bacterium]MDW8267433.1 helicase-associated domain-containing protein [Gemmataceae bacterium]
VGGWGGLTPWAWWGGGGGAPPRPPPAYPQTLLVQPNHEIIAYRQGLTPALLAQLTRFAAWKGVGAACTFQLRPDTVYRALEAGESLDSICRCLEQHGMRPVPAAVVDSLRTWANKRERIAVYPSGTLFEFAEPDDLNEALARGLPGVRLTDRLALVADESSVDFRHFRLTGTRDYSLPPEKCIDVDADGVTLTVDLARSDLLVEAELLRLAEPLAGTASSLPSLRPARRYRITPASAANARRAGLSLHQVEEWFWQRSGQALPPAARLVLAGSSLPAPRFRRLLVLLVASPDVADGLEQWPETKALIHLRLGPTALAVAEPDAATLAERLRALGVTISLDGIGDRSSPSAPA